MEEYCVGRRVVICSNIEQPNGEFSNHSFFKDFDSSFLFALM